MDCFPLFYFTKQTDDIASGSTQGDRKSPLLYQSVLSQTDECCGITMIHFIRADKIGALSCIAQSFILILQESK